MKDDCIFCKLANGIIPVEVLASNQHAVLIKDANPIAPEHLLVITKQHFDNLDDLFADETGWTYQHTLLSMYDLVSDYVHDHQLLAGGYRLVSNNGDNAGQTVKHLHFHLLGGAKLQNGFGAQS